jgi:hypothetical protein
MAGFVLDLDPFWGEPLPCFKSSATISPGACGSHLDGRSNVGQDGPFLVRKLLSVGNVKEETRHRAMNA